MHNPVPAEEAIREALAKVTELGEIATSVSAINAVRVPDDWWNGKHKIMMIGQEMGGEDRTLQWMADAEDGIAEVVESYETFDFAENTGKRGSPFWRAHRKLVNDLEDGHYRRVMWTNLVEVQSVLPKGTGIHNLPAIERNKVIDWQSPIVRAELQNIAPSGVVFFTGPNYDWILERVFSGAKLHPIDGSLHSTRALARVEHPLLPARSVRTYHPRALQQQKLWGLLDDIVAFMQS